MYRRLFFGFFTLNDQTRIKHDKIMKMSVLKISHEVKCPRRDLNPSRCLERAE